MPHYQPENATYFVTFRLAGSLPQEAIEALREEREKELRVLKPNSFAAHGVQKKHFAAFDRLLDRATAGPFWLRDEKIAEIVADAIRYRDGKAYELICYCVMPNHVHLVFSVGRRDSSSYIIADIMENLKWYTALTANRILGRRGAFWQHESYDHVVRNEFELERIVTYVMNNPVAAGLASTQDQWKWSHLRDEVRNQN